MIKATSAAVMMTSYDEMNVSYGIPFGDHAITFDRDMLETLHRVIGNALAYSPADFERMALRAEAERKAWDEAQGDVALYRKLKATAMAQLAA